MASSAAADADAPIVVRVTGGTRGVDRASTLSASASSSVDRMLDASLPPTFTGGDTFRAVLDWHLRSVPGDRNLAWRIGSRVLGADVPIDGRLADWVRVLGGSPITIAISAPGSSSAEHEAIKYAFACHLAGLPWPLWDADERDPVNRRLLGDRSEDAAAATGAPRRDEDNQISNLVGLRHGRHVKFVNVHALADAMKRGNTVEPVFRTNVADRMDDFVRCIQAAVYDSIHPYAADPIAGLLPIIELATMVVERRYGHAFAANARRAAAVTPTVPVPVPTTTTRAAILSPAAQQWEDKERERKKAAAAAAAAGPPPQQSDEEKQQRADMLARFTPHVHAYLRTTPDTNLSRALFHYASNSLEWYLLSVDEREALVRTEFSLFLDEKKRKEAVLVKLAAGVRAYLRDKPDATLERVQLITRDARNLRVVGAAELVPIRELLELVYDEFTRHTEERRVSAILGVGVGAGAGAAAPSPFPERNPAVLAKMAAGVRAKLTAEVQAYLHRNPDATLMRVQNDARLARDVRIAGAAQVVSTAELEKMVDDEFTRHAEKRRVAAGAAAAPIPRAQQPARQQPVLSADDEREIAAMLRAGDEAQLAGAVSAAAAFAHPPPPAADAKAAAAASAMDAADSISDQIRQQKSAAAAALSESSKKKKKKTAAADYPAIGWYDTKRIQNVVDAMTKEARRVVRGDGGAHMKTVKKAAVSMLDNAGLRTPEAKRELRLRLDQIQADAAWNASMDSMQAGDRRENGKVDEPAAAAAAAAAAASLSSPAPAPVSAAAGISPDEHHGIEYDIRSFVGDLISQPKTTLVEAEQANLFYRRALSAEGKKEQMHQALASYRAHVQSPAAAGNPRRSIVVLFRAAQKKAPDESSAYWSRESELMIELGRSPPVEQRAYKRMLAVVQEIELRVRIGEVAKDKAQAAIANAVLVDFSDKALGVEAGAAYHVMAAVDRLLQDDHEVIIRRIADEVTGDISVAVKLASPAHMDATEKSAVEMLKRAGVHTPDAIRKLKERMRKIHRRLKRDGEIPAPAAAASAAVEAEMRKRLDRAGYATHYDIEEGTRDLFRRDGIRDQGAYDSLVDRLIRDYIKKPQSAVPSSSSSSAAAAAAASSASMDVDKDGAVATAHAAAVASVEAKMRKKLDKIRMDGQQVTVFDINGPVHALLRHESVTDKAVVDGLVARLTKEYSGWVVAAPPAAAAAAAAASSAAANHLASRMQQLHW